MFGNDGIVEEHSTYMYRQWGVIDGFVIGGWLILHFNAAMHFEVCRTVCIYINH